MASISLKESGMTFGPFDEKDCFKIETSACYKRLTSKNHGIKSVEFVLYEAPQNQDKAPQNQGSLLFPQPGNKDHFDQFIEDVTTKFKDSLALYMALQLKRHVETADFHSNSLNIPMGKIELMFLLVIQKHKAEWLPTISDALRSKLMKDAQIWNFPTLHILALKDEMARKKKYE